MMWLMEGGGTDRADGRGLADGVDGDDRAGMWLMRWTGMIELKQVWADGVSVDDRDDSSDEGCVDGRADSRGVTDGEDGDDRAD